MAKRLANSLYVIVTAINHFIEDCDVFTSYLSAKNHFRKQIRANFKNISLADLEEAEQKGIIIGTKTTINWIEKDNVR